MVDQTPPPVKLPPAPPPAPKLHTHANSVSAVLSGMVSSAVNLASATPLSGGARPLKRSTSWTVGVGAQGMGKNDEAGGVPGGGGGSARDLKQDSGGVYIGYGKDEQNDPIGKLANPLNRLHEMALRTKIPLRPMHEPGKRYAHAQRTWLRVAESGELTTVTIEKHRISFLLRLPIRDLRVLEPTFATSYSAAILCREKSIVVNMESIKVLITATEVLVQDGDTPTVKRFVPELVRRLIARQQHKVTDAHGMPLSFSQAELVLMEDALMEGHEAHVNPLTHGPGVRDVSLSDLALMNSGGGKKKCTPGEAIAISSHPREILCDTLHIGAAVPAVRTTR